MDGSDVDAASETRLRGKESGANGAVEARRRAVSRALTGILVVGNAIAFLAASVIHFGYAIPLGFATVSDVTIIPAGIAEGVIGGAFVVAAAAVLGRRTWAWNATLAAYLLGIIGVFIGLGVSATDSGDSSRANFLFHLTILPVLVGGLAVLLTRGGRAGLGRSAATAKVSS